MNERHPASFKGRLDFYGYAEDARGRGIKVLLWGSADAPGLEVVDKGERHIILGDGIKPFACLEAARIYASCVLHTAGEDVPGNAGLPRETQPRGDVTNVVEREAVLRQERAGKRSL